MVNNHHHRLALINKISKLPYPKSYAAQDNGTINVGVIIEDPDDGQEDDQDQDGSEGKDSPQRENTKDVAIAVRHTVRDLVSHKKSSYK